MPEPPRGRQRPVAASTLLALAHHIQSGSMRVQSAHAVAAVQFRVGMAGQRSVQAHLSPSSTHSAACGVALGQYWPALLSGRQAGPDGDMRQAHCSCWVHPPQSVPCAQRVVATSQPPRDAWWRHPLQRDALPGSPCTGMQASRRGRDPHHPQLGSLRQSPQCVWSSHDEARHTRLAARMQAATSRHRGGTAAICEQIGRWGTPGPH